MELKGNKDALIEALLEWSAERTPDDPGDARLLQAIWRHEGDITEPCPECDGDCGEPCAPITADAACAALDKFIEDYNKRHGIRSIDISTP